jgi:PleD family two-component response regulator
MKTQMVEAEFLKGLRILIVDDMSFMRDVIRQCLTMSFPSCICDDAIDGKSAMTMLQTVSYNIVLCDFELPDIKGDEILKWVREESSVKDLPFIMVTANRDVDVIKHAQFMRVTDYVVKPLNCGVLSQKIRDALKPKQQAPASPKNN